MKVPNWKHHSKKEQKRTLKPQALRQAKARTKELKWKLKSAFLILNKNTYVPFYDLRRWMPFT